MATVITENIFNDFIQPVLQIYEKDEQKQGINYTHAHVKENTEFENEEEHTRFEQLQIEAYKTEREIEDEDIKKEMAMLKATNQNNLDETFSPKKLDTKADEENAMQQISMGEGLSMSTNLTMGLVDETELQISPNKTNRFSTGYIMNGDEAKGLMI